MTPKFDLQGHRGARGLFPENTLGGFIATCALGVDTLELDIAVTADGIAMVTHDPVLNPDITRTPDGAWLPVPGPTICHITAAELAHYDVGRLRPGSAYAARYRAQTPCDGARIPTLAEVFAHTGTTRIDAEIKTHPDEPDLTISPEAMADIVVATAEQAGALDRLIVRSFDWRALRHLRAHRPDIPLTWLTSAHTVANAALWWDIPGPILSVPAAIVREARAGHLITWSPVWAPEHPDLTQASLAEAHALGLRVIPWTVNDPADMTRLTTWGVDGLCTDRPDLAAPP